MKAMGLRSYGPPDVLAMIDLNDPTPGSGEIRVRVKAAGVQHFDCGVRAGEFPRSLVGDFPIIPGNEFAGVVDEVGDAVTAFSAGDPVLGFSTLGSYAEYVVVPADQVVPKPSGMPWVVAGGFSGAAQGARNALKEMRVTRGDTVLINGASGGLGTMATQLARIRGASMVIGTASEANHDYLRSLGATPVEYGPGLLERLREIAPEGIDAALGSEVEGLRTSISIAKDLDRVVTMIYSDEIAALGVHDWTGIRNAAGLAEMVGHYERGALTVHVRAEYPLDRAADAQRDVCGPHSRGKVVLQVA